MSLGPLTHKRLPLLPAQLMTHTEIIMELLSSTAASRAFVANQIMRRLSSRAPTEGFVEGATLTSTNENAEF
jgi:hypothetical protein